ncbi:BFD-like [2Fe-2S] binding domain-containing protein [Asaccharospora irregularis DSM 2635]|uniref:BFD-like [2Fe-2S] binding domain-containing protein n=2 Tax=Asaccharospora TaxID=1505660 RepID=A0A1M5KAV5_9FIRM|nr:copper chaperone Copz family protein [Asaccharospora irregularis]SHG49760.1 BFD-like [2Fe-2S] binding domain-containing protein [Asaccharospora irregularis DSM 2635]
MVEKNSLCPVCNQEGKLVKNITVNHMVFNEIKQKVGDTDYFLCINETCNIVYFNQEYDVKFNENEVKEPIWFKDDANPKYVCYCNKVAEEQVFDAVINKDAKNMKDIIRLTGAMKNGKCEIYNPLGKCCSPIVQEAIKKGLEIKENTK